MDDVTTDCVCGLRVDAHRSSTFLKKTNPLHPLNNAQVPASNMKKMIWDDDIARKAQAYTDRCMSVWDPTFIPYAFAYRDHAYDPVGVAKWRTWRMAPFYDFATGQCDDSPLSKRVCRHPENYRKVVMSGNTRVGCGKTVCGPGPKGVFHMCGIAGSDYVVNEPWAIGARCSACPADYKFCDHGLCSKTLSLNGSQGDWFYVPKTTKIGWY